MCHLSFTIHPSLMRRVFSSGGNWLWRVKNLSKMTHSSYVGRRVVGIRDSSPPLLTPESSPWAFHGGHRLGEGGRRSQSCPGQLTLCQLILDRFRGAGLGLNVPLELWLVHRIHTFLSCGALPSWRVCLLINPRGQAFQFPFHSWRYYSVHFFDGWRCTNRF